MSQSFLPTMSCFRNVFQRSPRDCFLSFLEFFFLRFFLEFLQEPLLDLCRISSNIFLVFRSVLFVLKLIHNFTSYSSYAFLGEFLGSGFGGTNIQKFFRKLRKKFQKNSRNTVRNLGRICGRNFKKIKEN